jgi:hypothetical protein
VSAATGTIDPTIVDGLIALPDKPAAAPLGASGQWQMLQPVRLRRTPSEAPKSVGASNDPWRGAFLRNRLPRSSSLTGSGGLCPVDSPAKLTCATIRSSISKGKLSSIGLAHSRPPYAGSNGNRTPVFLPRAWRNGAGTNPPPSADCASAGRAVGQAVLSKDPRPPLPPGRRGSAALVSSRQAITAPGGREHIEHERRS